MLWYYEDKGGKHIFNFIGTICVLFLTFEDRFYRFCFPDDKSFPKSVFRLLSYQLFFIVDLSIADDVDNIMRAKQDVRSMKAVITKLKSVKLFFPK